VDRALGRRRGAAGRPVRAADGSRRASYHPSHHLRRDARAGRGRGLGAAPGRVHAGCARAALPAPSGPLPDPVRRRQGGRGDGAARRERGLVLRRRRARRDLRGGGPDVPGDGAPAGRRRRPHLPGARGGPDPPASGQAAPLVRWPAGRRGRGLGRQSPSDRHRGRFRLPGLPAGRRPSAGLRRLRAGAEPALPGAGRRAPLPRRLRHDLQPRQPPSRRRPPGRAAVQLFQQRLLDRSAVRQGRGAGRRRGRLERPDRRPGPLDHLPRRAHRLRAAQGRRRLGLDVLRPLR